MADRTAIEWTDATVNFWWGCTKVGPGCDHCYAEGLANRFGTSWGQDMPRRWIKGAAATLGKLNRTPGKRVFIQSMSDIFDNEVPVEWFHDAWRGIIGAVDCRIQILTKRISMVEKRLANMGSHWPQHAGLMITVVNQAEADRDIPRLLALKAKLGIPWVGLSIEPLLGPVDLGRWMASANVTCKACKTPFWLHEADPCEHEEGGGAWTIACPNCGNCRCKPAWTPADARTIDMAPPQDWIDRAVGRFDRVHPSIELRPMIDWVIVGGESGPKARPMHPDWARSLRDQCQAAGVPFFFKQWGEWAPRYMPGVPETDPPLETTPRASWHDACGLITDTLAAPDDLEFWCEGQTYRVGKARAGRLLDGVEHNTMPGVW